MTIPAKLQEDVEAAVSAVSGVRVLYPVGSGVGAAFAEAAQNVGLGDGAARVKVTDNDGELLVEVSLGIAPQPPARETAAAAAAAIAAACRKLGVEDPDVVVTVAHLVER